QTNADKLKFYFDSIQQTLGFNGNIPNKTAYLPSYPVQIGKMNYYFSGIIDQVLIYNRSLKPYEVNAHYLAAISNRSNYVYAWLSPVLDGGKQTADWKEVSWEQEIPAGTNITVQFRAGNSSSYNASTWTDWSIEYNTSSGVDINSSFDYRYLQLKFNFYTYSPNVTPVLKSFTVNYSMEKVQTNNLGWLQFAINDTSLPHTFEWESQNLSGVLRVRALQIIDLRPFGLPIIDNVTTANLSMSIAINASTLQGSLTNRNISRVWVNITKPSGTWENVTLSGPETGGKWQASYVPDLLGPYTTKFYWESTAGDTAILRMGEFEVRTLLIGISSPDNKGYDKIVFEPGDKFNVTACIKEFNGSHYFNVTSGNFDIKISTDSGYVYGNLTYVDGCEWRANFTAPMTIGTYTIYINGTSYLEGIYGSNQTNYHVNQKPLYREETVTVEPDISYYYDNFTFNISVKDNEWNDVNVTLFVSTDNKTTWQYKGSVLVTAPGTYKTASITTTFAYTDVGSDNYYKFQLDDSYFRVNTTEYEGPSEIRSQIVINLTQDHYYIYRNDSFSPYNVTFNIKTTDASDNLLEGINVTLYRNSTFIGNCTTNASGECRITYNPEYYLSVGNYSILANASGAGYDYSTTTSWLILNGKLYPQIDSPAANSVLLRGASYNFNSTTTDDNGTYLSVNIDWHLLNSSLQTVDSFGQNQEDLIYTFASNLTAGTYYIKINVSKPFYDNAQHNISITIKYRSAVNITQGPSQIYRGNSGDYYARVYDFDNDTVLPSYTVSWYVDSQFKQFILTGPTGYSIYTFDTTGYSLGMHEIKAEIGSKGDYIPWINSSNISMEVRGILYINITSPGENQIANRGSFVQLNSSVWDDTNNEPTNAYNVSWLLNGMQILNQQNGSYQIPWTNPIGLNNLSATAYGNYYDNGTDSILIKVFGYSELYNITTDKTIYLSGEPIMANCSVRDSNTSIAIANYPVKFYFNYSYQGTNLTNSYGIAFFEINTSGANAGFYNISCELEDNASLFYNVSRGWIDREIEIRRLLVIKNVTAQPAIIYRNSSASPHEANISVEVWDGAIKPMPNAIAHFYLPNGYENCTTSSNGICSILWDPPDNYLQANYTIFVNATKPGSNPSSTENISVEVVTNPVLELNTTTLLFTPAKMGENSTRGQVFVIFSLGDTNLTNISISCISGIICQNFTISLSNNNFDLEMGKNKTIEINLSVPANFNNFGDFDGILRIRAANVNRINTTKTTKFINMSIHVFKEETMLRQEPQSITVGNIQGDVITKVINLTLENKGSDNITQINLTLRFNTSFYGCIDTLTCNDMIIYPSYQNCSLIEPNTTCNKTFYINISATTEPYDFYKIVGKASYINLDNSYGSAKNITNLDVNPTYALKIAPDQFSGVVNHGQSKQIGVMNISNTGNTVISNVNLIPYGGNLTASWLTITPDHYAGIDKGATKHSTITVSLPAGTAPGKYWTYINVTSDQAETKQAMVNITVPIDYSWSINPSYTERSVWVDLPGTFNLTISNEGNVNQSFSLSCASQNSSILTITGYPQEVNVSKQASENASINYFAASSGNTILQCTVTNKQNNEQKTATFNVTVIDIAPILYEPPAWYQYRDINYESQVIEINISDNHQLQDNWAWINVTGTEEKVINMSIKQTLGSNPPNYTFTGNFTPTMAGLYYFVIYAKDDAGYTNHTAQYQFYAIQSTDMEIATNTSRAIAGVTLTNGKCFDQAINITNLGSGATGYGGAYYTNLSITNLPSGWSADPPLVSYGKVKGGETKSTTIQICVPAATPAGSYSFVVRVDWINPNNYASYKSEIVDVDVLPTPQLEVSSVPPIDNFTHGTTREASYVLSNTGNVKVNNITLYRADSLTINTTIAPDFITALSMGESSTIYVNITVPLGFSPGPYQIKINHEGVEASVLQTIFLTVLESKEWNISTTKISKLVASNTSGKFAEINLTNNGNVQLDFSLNITGNISSYLSYPTSLSVQKQSTELIVINFSSPATKTDYMGNLTISSPGANPENMSIALTMGVRPLEIDLKSYTNETNASEPISLVVNLTYDNKPVDTSNWNIKVGGKACTELNASYNSKLWYIACIAPELKDGYYYDLELRAAAIVNGSNIEGLANYPKAIYYYDISPPVIESILAEEKEVANETAKANQTIIANITDATKVASADIVVEKEGSVVYSGPMTNISGNTYSVNITNLGIGDYDFSITASDGKYANSTKGWFEVYIGNVYFTGNANDAAGNPYTTQFKFYRPGKNFSASYEIKTISFSAQGSYNKKVHKRVCDLIVTGFNHIIKMRNVNIADSVTEPLRMDDIEKPLEDGVEKASYAAEHGIIYFKKVLGIVSNLNFSYAELILNTGSYDPNTLLVYKCADWSFSERECDGQWTEVTGLERGANTISFTITSFSAYALVTIECGLGYVTCGNICYRQEVCPYCCNGVCSNTSCTVTGTGAVTGGGGGGGGGYIERVEEKKAVCGNGVCEATESWENCPEDCEPPLPPSSVSSNIVDVKLYPGESKTYSIWITNNMNSYQTATLSVRGPVWEFVRLEKERINVAPLSTRTVKVKFVTDTTTQPGVYTGDILIAIGNKTHTLPVTLTVLPEQYALLDVKVEALTKYILPRDALRFYVSLYNLGIKKRFDVTLDYQIKEMETEKTITHKMETMAIETSLSFVKMYDLSNISLTPGKYYITVVAMYENKTASSADMFEVITPPWWYKYIPWIIAGIVAIAVLIYVYKWHKKKVLERLRYLTPVDYKTLPTGGLRIGKIAETDRKAYLSKDDLVTHVITAGATGSGKTVSAMVIVEECLLQKIPVIVFDPTGQWTGFVKPCRDSRMLSKYPEFGLKEIHARSFPGMIYEVTDPNVKIDLRKYMNPGEITIFTLNKLKPGEYDIAVKNIIDLIFEQGWEESPTLRMLIVFDEVHRLLERYGGKGGYIVLEKAAREFRKWGIGLIMISQVLSDFKEALKGNVLTEIQLNTKLLNDIKRAKEKYGEEYAKRITREEVGVGMIQNPRYNRGKPYWVAFRPLLHSPHKIPNKELELYKRYAKELEEIEKGIEKRKKAGKEVFDLELEFRLASQKLKAGKFRVVDIYIQSLKARLKE
ncbi:MAG: hypothetical protein DRP03_01245, partial [Candidatus Aenigmatarchaeota archaeon]